MEEIIYDTTLDKYARSVAKSLDDADLQTKFRNYDLFPLNFVSAYRDRTGLRFFRGRRGVKSERSSIECGMRKIFLVTDYGIESANRAGMILAESIAANLIDLNKNCAEGILAMGDPDANADMIQNDVISSAIRAILSKRAEENPTPPTADPLPVYSNWLCMVRIDWEITISSLTGEN